MITPGTQLVEYKEVTNYIPTRPAKARNVKVYNSQNNELLIEIDCEIIGGQIMTCVAYGSLSDFKFKQIIDDINETVMPDETKIRLYNLDSTDVSVTITSRPPSGILSADLVHDSGTNYIKMNPGDYNLQIRFPSQTRPINMNLNLKPGRIYTLYIISGVSPDSANYDKLNIPQVILVVDGNTLFNKCVWS